jgi:hypothetical protein
LGEGQQATIASRVGPNRGLGERAAYRVSGGGGEGVAVGVDADHPINGAGQSSKRLLPARGLIVSAWRHRAALL